MKCCARQKHSWIGTNRKYSEDNHHSKEGSLEDIKQIAALISQRNGIHKEIAKIIGRPAQSGHVGEYLASRLFDIELEESATNPGSDGYFRIGSLAGKSVNIKWYGKRENILDINPDHLPDYYLVLAGPKTAPQTSRGSIRPWVIDSVFLFSTSELIEELKSRGVKIGVATSVRKHLWEDAEIYPENANSQLALTNDKKNLLRLFK